MTNTYDYMDWFIHSHIFIQGQKGPKHKNGAVLGPN